MQEHNHVEIKVSYPYCLMFLLLLATQDQVNIDQETFYCEEPTSLRSFHDFIQFENKYELSPLVEK